MDDFPDVWRQLTRTARSRETVRTFVRESENRVEYDDDQDAIVFTSTEPDALPRELWKRAWERLNEEDELTKKQFKDATGKHRASIALPFLAEALDLPSYPAEQRVWLADENDG